MIFLKLNMNLSRNLLGSFILLFFVTITKVDGSSLSETVDVKLDHNRVYVLSDNQARGISFSITYADSAALSAADTFYLHLPNEFQWDSASIMNENDFTITYLDSRSLMFEAPANIDTIIYNFTSCKVNPGALTNEFKPITVSLYQDSVLVDTTTNGLKVVKFDTIEIPNQYYIDGDNRDVDEITIKLTSAGFYPHHNLYLQLPNSFKWNTTEFEPPDITPFLQELDRRLKLSFDSTFSPVSSLILSELKIIASSSTSIEGVIEAALLDNSETYSPQYESPDTLFVDRPSFTLSYDPVTIIGDLTPREFPKITIHTTCPQVLNGRSLTVSLPNGLTWDENSSDTTTINLDNIDTTQYKLVQAIFDSFVSENSNSGIEPLSFTFDSNDNTYTSEDSITITSIVSDQILKNRWFRGDGPRNVQLDTISFSFPPFKKDYYFFLHLPDEIDSLVFTETVTSPTLGNAEYIDNGKTLRWSVESSLPYTIFQLESLVINIPITTDTFQIEYALLRDSTYNNQNQTSSDSIYIFYSPQYTLEFEPVAIVRDPFFREFPDITIQTQYPEALNSRTLTVTLPNNLTWKTTGDSVFDRLFTNVANVDTTYTISMPKLQSDSTATTGQGAIIFKLDENNSPSTTQITVSEITLPGSFDKNSWFKGDGPRNVEFTNIEFSPSPFKEGYYFYLHLPSTPSYLTFENEPTSNMGQAELSDNGKTLKWEIIESEDTIFTLDSLMINIPSDTGSYDIEFLFTRGSSYTGQPQGSIITPIMFYEPEIRLSQNIVLISNSPSTEPQYGGSLSIIIENKNGYQPFYSNRNLSINIGDTVKNIDSLSSADWNVTGEDGGTKLKTTFDNNYSGTEINLNELLIAPRQDSLLPTNITFEVNGGSSWLTTETIRTATLTIDSISLNRIEGDTNVFIEPFTIQQSPNPIALINDYYLILTDSDGQIDASSLGGLPAGITDSLTNNNELILKITAESVSTTPFSVIGLKLNRIDNNGDTLNWYFVANEVISDQSKRVPLNFPSHINTGVPSFELVCPDTDEGYNLSNFYRPVYLVDDPHPRPLLSLKIKDDQNYPVLANRELRIILPGSIKWHSWGNDPSIVSITSQNNSTLVIILGEYVSDSLQVDSIKISHFDTSLVDSISLHIVQNDSVRTTKNSTIKIVEPPQLGFPGEDTFQVFWLGQNEDQTAKWKLKRIISSSQNGFFYERNIYFRTDTSSHLVFNNSDTTFFIDVDSTNTIDTIRIDTLTIKKVFENDSLFFAITGNPDDIKPAYWIHCSFVLRSVDPTINVLPPRVFLKEDFNESLIVNITTDYAVAFRESYPFVELPDSFPGSFSSDSSTVTINDWGNDSTVTFSFLLNSLTGVMDWAPLTLRHPDSHLAIDDSASFRVSGDAIKVGTYWAKIESNRDTLIFTHNDPPYSLTAISIRLGYDSTTNSSERVQPLIQGDTVYVFLDTLDIGAQTFLKLDDSAVQIRLNGIETDKLDSQRMNSDNTILSIPVADSLSRNDTLLTIGALRITEFRDSDSSIVPLTVSLRPPAETNHKIDILTNIGIGYPEVQQEVNIYTDLGFERPAFRIKEDSHFKTLVCTSEDSLSILCFTILTETSQVSWDTSINSYTSGYGSGWDNINHYPVSVTPLQKCYTIESTFDKNESTFFYLFDNLLFDDDSLPQVQNVELAVSNNGGSNNFDTTTISLKPPPRCQFDPSEQDLIVLKSDSSFSLANLKITNVDTCVNNIILTIPNDLSCEWDSVTYDYEDDEIDSVRTKRGSNNEARKVLIIYLSESFSQGDTVKIDSASLTILENAASGMGRIRVHLDTTSCESSDLITSIFSENMIVLGAPKGDMNKHLILIRSIDDTVALPILVLNQDPILLNSYGYSFIDSGHTVTVSIPEDIDEITFDISQQVMWGEDYLLENKITPEEKFFEITIDTSFKTIQFDSIKVLLNTTDINTINPFSLEFQLNGVRFGETVRQIRLTNPIIIFDEKHLSVDPDDTFKLGKITIEQGSVPIFLQGVQIAISAVLDFKDGERYIKWKSNPFSGQSNLTIDPDSTKAYATTESGISDSLSLLLNTRFDINSLLSSDEFVVDSFKNGRDIHIHLGFISNEDVRFSADTVLIKSDKSFKFNLPAFLNPPIFSGKTLSFDIIRNLYDPKEENADWIDVFHLLPADNPGDFFDLLSDTFWPNFTNIDTINTNEPTPNTVVISHPAKPNIDRNIKNFRNVKPIDRRRSKIQKRVKLYVDKNNIKRKKVTKDTHEVVKGKELLPTLISTTTSTGNNIQTVNAVFDDSTLIWFNELLFDHINNPNDRGMNFYIGLTDSVSSIDDTLQNTTKKPSWAAVPVKFGSFNPLADSAMVENLKRIFNVAYQLTLQDTSGMVVTDYTVNVFSAGDDSLFITTDLSELRTFTADSLEEGLYLVKVDSIQDCFTVYRQIIKDTTRPQIAGFSPPFKELQGGKALSVSLEADSLEFWIFNNWALATPLLYNYQFDSISVEGRKVLIYNLKVDTLQLWAPLIPIPNDSITFTIQITDTMALNTIYLLPISSITFDSTLNYSRRFSEFLTSSQEGDITLIITSTDASGNHISDTLRYNVIAKGGKEGVISDHIFNYPNPFRVGERTTFRYVLSAEAVKGQLAIFDAGGDLVYYWDLRKSDPNNGAALHTPGTHLIHWDGTNLFGKRLSTGVYFGYFEVNYDKKKPDYSFLKIAINNR